MFFLNTGTKARPAKSLTNASQGAPGSAIESVTSGLGTSGIPLPRWKRAIDLAGCFLALPVLGLGTMVMIILTKRVSPGPIFYRQERIGYMGRRFGIYKFRTMKAGADSAVHHEHVKALIQTNAPMVKLDSRRDPRLIPLGWLLRASGLDELPQVINVLRGEMSLVGPRPCTPAEFEHYVSWQRQRCDALPGLTGLWQVSGKNRTTFEQMIRFDIQYIRELSFRRDVKILLRTTPCMLTQIRETRLARKSLPDLLRDSTLDVPQDNPRQPTPGPVAKMKDCTLSVKNTPKPILFPEIDTKDLIGWLEELRRTRSESLLVPKAAEPPVVIEDNKPSSN